MRTMRIVLISLAWLLLYGFVVFMFALYSAALSGCAPVKAVRAGSALTQIPDALPVPFLAAAVPDKICFSRLEINKLLKELKRRKDRIKGLQAQHKLALQTQAIDWGKKVKQWKIEAKTCATKRVIREDKKCSSCLAWKIVAVGSSVLGVTATIMALVAIFCPTCFKSLRGEP